MDKGGGLVSLFGPREIEQSSGSHLQVADSTGAVSRGTTVIERASNGHYMADVRVEGVDVAMMIDTGASFVALTAADAETIGLFWDDSDAVVVAHGASGPVKGIPVRLDEVELGDHLVRDVRAAIIPEGLGVSLLGQSYLSGVAHVEIAEGRMVLTGE